MKFKQSYGNICSTSLPHPCTKINLLDLYFPTMLTVKFYKRINVFCFFSFPNRTTSRAQAPSVTDKLVPKAISWATGASTTLRNTGIVPSQFPLLSFSICTSLFSRRLGHCLRRRGLAIVIRTAILAIAQGPIPKMPTVEFRIPVL